MYPQIAINDEKWHPIYEMCIELDIPFFFAASECQDQEYQWHPQKVELIDEVCWYFPELNLLCAMELNLGQLSMQTHAQIS